MPNVHEDVASSDSPRQRSDLTAMDACNCDGHSFRRAVSNRLHRSGAPFRDPGPRRLEESEDVTEVYLLPDEEAQRRALEGAESEQSRR